MKRNAFILLFAAGVVALPFLLRAPEEQTSWRPGDPVLVIITPHNEAIRYEFDHAFSRWHEARYGRPVRIDWRAIGGTTEISRYLTASYVSAARAWWTGEQNRNWPPGAGETLVDRRFNLEHAPLPTRKPGESEARFARRAGEETKRWETMRELYRVFRETDDKAYFSAGIDLFFGGGDYDHRKAFEEGLTVPPWPAEPPQGLFRDADGNELIPARIAGETWRTATFFGNAISTFGICYNFDRLRDLGIEQPPRRWEDLADPRYFRQLGLADPTKSGSIAKAFELIIHQQCGECIRRAGFTEADIDRFESLYAAARLPPGERPDGVPPEYAQALEQGWLNGIRLVQRIGANAGYFSVSPRYVHIDF